MKEHTTHFDDCGCKTARLETEIARLRDALESIASISRKEQEKESYWINLTLKECAEVLAADTRIAREALGESK